MFYRKSCRQTVVSSTVAGNKERCKKGEVWSHEGREGRLTMATHVKDGWIKLQWLDGGGTSRYIKLEKLWQQKQAAGATTKKHASPVKTRKQEQAETSILKSVSLYLLAHRLPLALTRSSRRGKNLSSVSGGRIPVSPGEIPDRLADMT